MGSASAQHGYRPSLSAPEVDRRDSQRLSGATCLLATDELQRSDQARASASKYASHARATDEARMSHRLVSWRLLSARSGTGSLWPCSLPINARTYLGGGPQTPCLNPAQSRRIAGHNHAETTAETVAVPSDTPNPTAPSLALLSGRSRFDSWRGMRADCLCWCGFDSTLGTDRHAAQRRYRSHWHLPDRMVVGSALLDFPRLVNGARCSGHLLLRRTVRRAPSLSKSLYGFESGIDCPLHR
jgi:hypothetical protein